MKKLLLFLVFAGFLACENEIIQELPQETSVTEGIAARENQKIDVCHYDAENNSWHVINISINAWKGHEKHGDVMLVDADGDGWVTLENECGVPVDCDDTDAGVNEICLAIGNLYAGGIIFYLAETDEDLNGDGEPDQGLVCSLNNFAWTPWGCYRQDLPSVPNVAWNGGNPTGLGAEIGDGMTNTNSILLDCPTAPAALAARSLGPEWFLPSAKELNEMYDNKTKINEEAVDNGGENFVGYYYWSSTEANNYFAWRQSLGYGYQGYNSKYVTFYVRAVRAF